MIYVASIPRCGSTYLVRSIAHLGQGGFTPADITETHGIVKTHRPPPDDLGDDDRCVFLFGDIPQAVVSTRKRRWDPKHFQNCGVTWDPDADIFLSDVLGYTRLFLKWFTMAPLPVLFVRYDAMAYEAPRRLIESWLDSDIAWLPWRRRHTRVGQRQRQQIEIAYAQLSLTVERLPAVSLVLP